ncbi:hypothetical protein OTUT144_1575 [Orientia tsutsugamushi str. UT144]|uniref:Outer membrane protein beta-barrel domain-containing protein n=1 Tax=Orientia tsutsugamushi str. UT144 TaxID=1441384 RepID=A0A0F3RJU5_ORITS|nr:hypothetical protein [Orientia tsutsugamushi]KJW06392.1 hypothetical protein OTUT144_1575 [Orientia tsutsugamushi str. UT144]
MNTRIKKVLLAITLLSLYSFPSVASDIECYDRNYYLKISMGITNSTGQFSIENSKNILDNDWRTNLQMINNAITNRSSAIYGMSLGTHCTQSIRLEVGGQYIKNLQFGGDIEAVDQGIKVSNHKIGSDIDGGISGVGGMIKVYWNIISVFDIVSAFATGGLTVYGLNMLHEPISVFPGFLVGGGVSLNISHIHFGFEYNYTSLSVKENLEINSQSLGQLRLNNLYGYNVLGSVWVDF